MEINAFVGVPKINPWIGVVKTYIPPKVNIFVPWFVQWNMLTE